MNSRQNIKAFSKEESDANFNTKKFVKVQCIRQHRTQLHYRGITAVKAGKEDEPAEGIGVESVTDAGADFAKSSEVGFSSTLISTFLLLCGVDLIVEDSV